MENPVDILALDPQAKIKTYKKGHIIQHAGDQNVKTFFVRRGLLRSYIIDSKGKEHIFMFATEGWVIADVESLEFNKQTELYIDCLEDSEVILFNRDSLFNADISRETIAENSRLLFRRMGMLQRRILMLMSTPAIDRYLYFVKIYPDLINRVPQHMIATYLGITPQALSTLRGKIVRGK